MKQNYKCGSTEKKNLFTQALAWLTVKKAFTDNLTFSLVINHYVLFLE